VFTVLMRSNWKIQDNHTKVTVKISQKNEVSLSHIFLKRGATRCAGENTVTGTYTCRHLRIKNSRFGGAENA
jgi:hypothetical protein